MTAAPATRGSPRRCPAQIPACGWTVRLVLGGPPAHDPVETGLALGPGGWRTSGWTAGRPTGHPELSRKGELGLVLAPGGRRVPGLRGGPTARVPESAHLGGVRLHEKVDAVDGRRSSVRGGVQLVAIERLPARGVRGGDGQRSVRVTTPGAASLGADPAGEPSTGPNACCGGCCRPGDHGTPWSRDDVQANRRCAAYDVAIGRPTLPSDDGDGVRCVTAVAAVTSPSNGASTGRARADVQAVLPPPGRRQRVGWRQRE